MTELTGKVFQGLENLETLVFESAIRIQGVAATEEEKNYFPFGGTSKLSSITFGGSVELGARVFNYSSSSPNTALKELTFPEGSTFGAEVFKYCNNLETITFNGDVDLTAGYCFSNLNGLKTLNFNGESKLSSAAFAYTSNLATITFGGKTELGGGAFQYGTYGLNNTALTELTFPAGSTFQGGVFGNCDNLKKITFAGDVVWPSGFFGNLPNLTTLDFQGESVLQSGALAGTTKLAEIHFGGKTQISASLFNYSSSPNTALKELTFPAGSEFGPSIFNNCTALKTITFEGDADVATGSCFNNLPALTTLEFKGTSKISSGAFNGSTRSLTTIKFDDKTDVSNGVFIGSAVTELTFPEGSTFGAGVFSNCAALEKITFEGDADVTKGSCFAGSSALTTLEFKGTSKIGYNAFNGSTSRLTKIIFGNKTDVGANGFSGSAVTELTFPEGSTFGQNVFLNCTALEKITFEGDVDVSAGGCFSGSSALQTVVFKGESVLGGGSFANANKLKSIIFTGETTLKTKALVGVGSALEVMDPIVLPEGSMVAAEVFKDLKISSVAFKDSTPQTFEKDTFKGCPTGTKIIVPCGTVESYTAALNDGESPANPDKLAIEAGSKHIYVNGACVCGQQAPISSVTVNNGSGDGEYPEGVTVTIQADAPEEGKRFKCWTVISGGVTLENASSSCTTFTMPGNAVEITAEYEAIPKYAVTVTNGEGTGEYKQGDTVTITAAAPEAGKQFKEWTVEKGNVTLANSTSATTTFTMPAEKVSVTAVYKDKSSSGGSTGGGNTSGGNHAGDSGNTGETTGEVITSKDPENNTNTTTLPTEVKIEGGTASATVKAENVTEAIKQTMKNQSKEIVFHVSEENSKEAVKVQLTISKVDVQQIVEQTDATFVVTTTAGDVLIPQDALKEAVSAAGGNDIAIEIGRVTTPTAVQKEAAGENSYIVEVTITSQNKAITTFGGNTLKIRLEIPAALTGKDVAVIHIAADGKTEKMPGKMVQDGAKQHYEFTTTHLSTFALVDSSIIKEDTPTVTAPKKGTLLTDSKTRMVYKVTKSGRSGGAVQFVKTKNTKAKTITIPDKVTFDGITYKVTSIAANALNNNKTVTTVTIGKYVTSIGSSACSGCTKLKKVTIGKSVTTIGSKAFYQCTSLTGITIPAQVKKIGNYVFKGCSKLKTIKIQTTLLNTKTVFEDAFSGLSTKAEIKVPKDKLEIYKKLLVKKGLSRKVTIKTV